MDLELKYQPSEKQTKFHTSTADETLYGGAAGGGKTAALVAEAITLALEHAGIRVYIFRRTIPELKESVVPEVLKQAGDLIEAGIFEYKALDRYFKFTNGSTIQLAYLKDPADKFRYQSAEIHALLIDELTHFNQDDYEYLLTRVRSTEKFPLKTMACTNPGGKGHGWVKARFIEPNPPMEVFEADGMKRQYIPATIDDHPNAQFRESYKKQLKSLNDEHLKRALLEGDWDLFSGQVFKEWRRAKHIVAPFEIPHHWQRWQAYDPGFVNPAALWFAKDPMTERIYIYREYYKKNQPISAQAADFKLLEGNEDIRTRLSGIDLFTSAADKATSGETFDKIFGREGFYFNKGITDRLAGKNAWHEALADAADGLPRLQVFENCTNLINLIPTLVYDQRKPEHVADHPDDHLYDAGRYGLLTQAQKKRVKSHIPAHIAKRKARH